MANLHIRDLPDDVHQTLVRRAREQSMSLRAYVVELLSRDAHRLTTDEWLDAARKLPPIESSVPAAELIRAEREERDQEILDALSDRR